jgi:predicted polyphosphate/ATP-dependent NAD kinase
MKVGLVVNPWAGVGGTVALKGSDGPEIRALAVAKGAVQHANDKTMLMLQAFKQSVHEADQVYWYCGPAQMGEQVLQSSGVTADQMTVQPIKLPAQTEASDTVHTVRWLVSQNIDLLVFAGGDGTARNICDVIGGRLPVLGIPAGVKIHSGVFAVTPHAAGEVLAGLINGDITELHEEEVRDIDEAAFRENRVVSKHFGDMNVPVSGEFMQHVKVGGFENEALVLSDIADWLVENLDRETVYFIGSGKTTATLMAHLNAPNTLLGIDAYLNGQVIKQDCTEQDILDIQQHYPVCFILSIIGGQGHILGRGNAQISPAVLRNIEKSQLWLIGTKAKLKSLAGRPLLVDTSDPELDKKWAGLMPVITGYNDQVIYPVAAL